MTHAQIVAFAVVTYAAGYVAGDFVRGILSRRRFRKFLLTHTGMSVVSLLYRWDSERR